MPVLFQDYETRSACPLETAGLWTYVRHHTTDLQMCAWVIGDAEPQLWLPGQPVPPEVIAHTRAGHDVVMHNAPFDFNIQNHVGVRYGWPRLDLDQIVCTLARARVMALPGKLEALAAALNLEARKDSEGHRVMRQLASPRGFRPDGSPIFWREQDVAPHELADLREKEARVRSYCLQDLRVLREVYKRTVPLSGLERRIWALNVKINERGVGLDVQAARAALELVEKEQERVDAAVREKTGGAVSSCRAHVALAKWVRSFGIETEGVDQDDVWELLERNDLPPVVREVLEIRRIGNKSSTAKLRAMLLRVAPDGRLHDLFEYCLASTHRFGSRFVQLHNFIRPRDWITQEEIESVLAALPKREPGFADYLRVMFGSVLEMISDCLRGMLIAAPGHVFIGPDYAAFEMVAAAWLAGEQKILDTVRERGSKYLYRLLSSRVFHIPIQAVGKGDKYQFGKIGTLTCQYEGGERAIKKSARRQHLVTTVEQRLAVRDAYRDEYPRMVQYWKDLERAAISAVRAPGTGYGVGAPERRVVFRMNGSFLTATVPSGGKLYFPYPRIIKKRLRGGRTVDALVYKGMDEDKPGIFITKDLYGGKILQNITEKFTRDILANAMLKLDGAGHPITLDIHDEIVNEVPEWLAAELKVEIERLVAEVPAWAAGVPITVEAFVGRRYRK